MKRTLLTYFHLMFFFLLHVSDKDIFYAETFVKLYFKFAIIIEKNRKQIFIKYSLQQYHLDKHLNSN